MAKCTEDAVVCPDGLFCSVTELCDCVAVCLDGLFCSLAELCDCIVVCLDGLFAFSS